MRLFFDSISSLTVYFVLTQVAFGALSAHGAPGPTVGQQQPDLPLTIAEESDFKSTSTSAEVETLTKAYCDSAKHAQPVNFGTTVEGREMTATIISKKPYQLGQQDDRFVALVIGNIHSGECAGKEALLMMIRELAQQPEHRWLENMVLVIVPNYNADANDRMGLNNRCLLYTSPSPRDQRGSRMPSSA